MKYRISKTFTFAAAHQLTQLPAGHKCARMHGHNYTVTAVLESDDLDPNGFVQDYGDLADVKTFIDTTLDHQNLSGIFTWPVTAEHLAAYLYKVFVQEHPLLTEVVVAETANSTASYRP